MAESKVPSVTSVALEGLEGFPPKVSVSVVGKAATSGWNATGDLSPYSYFVPPQDGVYEFNFVADSPSPGAVIAQIETRIRASYIVDPIPPGFKGVKVYGESNFKTAFYNE